MAADRRALADPRFLLAVGVLVVNDHWAKAAFGNWLTGKLSDVAGLLVVGVLVRLALPDRRRAGLGVLGVGAAFAVIKAVPIATAAAVVVADAVLPWSNSVVTDASDLIALPVLFAARPIVEQPIVWWSSRAVRGRRLPPRRLGFRRDEPARDLRRRSDDRRVGRRRRLHLRLRARR